MSEDPKSVQQQRSIPLSEKQRNSERSPSLHDPEKEEEFKSIQKKKSTFQPREEPSDGKAESPTRKLDYGVSAEKSKNELAISPSKRIVTTEENKDIGGQENIFDEKPKNSPQHQAMAKKASFKDDKMSLKPLSELEECLQDLEDSKKLLRFLAFLRVRDLIKFLQLNHAAYKRYYKPVWSAIICRYYNVSAPNPLLSRKIMPKILRKDIENRSVFLEKVLKHAAEPKKKNQQRIVEKGTASHRSDKLLEKQIIRWSPLVSVGDSETEENCIGIALSNFYVSYYSVDKRLVLWKMEENSQAVILLEMLHPLDDVFKECYIEADRYLMLKFEREAAGKESFHTIYCIDSMNIKEVEGRNPIKNSALMTIYIDNVIPPTKNPAVRKSILKDPKDEDIKRLFTVEENFEERQVRFKSDTLPCNFNAVKVLKKIQLICCIDYDNSIMLLLDMTGQEQYRLVPLRYCKPILNVHVITKGEKEYLLVVSNQELAELCVYREADKLIFESKRQKLPMTFQTNIKTLCLGKQNSNTRGLVILYDDQKWVLYEIFKGVLGIQEISEWFKPNERAKIGEIWVQEKRKKHGIVKERVLVEIEVVRLTKDWTGFFEMLVFKARADKLLNREHDGRFKEVMRLKLEEDILYRQKIVRCLNYNVAMIGYFVSTNTLENYFVVKLWKRQTKEEDAEEIMEIRRGVILREPPGHKKIAWKSEMENGKMKLSVIGNGKLSERFMYLFDVENVWDAVGYEGKTKLKELI